MRHETRVFQKVCRWLPGGKSICPTRLVLIVETSNYREVKKLFCFLQKNETEKDFDVILKDTFLTDEATDCFWIWNDRCEKDDYAALWDNGPTQEAAHSHIEVAQTAYELLNEAFIEKDISSVFEQQSPRNKQPQENKVTPPTTIDIKSLFTALTTDMSHGAQVGGAVEARQFIMDIFYGSLGGREKMPAWLLFVPERILAVLVSIGLYFLATFMWTTMPFGKQVAYACRLCWEADGRDIVQPYAARLRLAIEKVGPSLPSLPTQDT